MNTCWEVPGSVEWSTSFSLPYAVEASLAVAVLLGISRLPPRILQCHSAGFPLVWLDQASG
ncbi:unnamed protein product [Gulo gulo]|uniref:Uncharacterized protein n=1 Tax=Gulo gulo TaxID=48420 RepID=A0A9X9Q0G1_GULGU|nr:unnamed protein product [Gulo gulo]